MNFEFANPEFLYLLLLLPVLLLLRGASGKSGSIIFSSTAIASEVAKKNKKIRRKCSLAADGINALDYLPASMALRSFSRASILSWESISLVTETSWFSADT